MIRLALAAAIRCPEPPAAVSARSANRSWPEPGKAPAARTPTPTRQATAVLKRGGGFYKDDGPRRRHSGRPRRHSRCRTQVGAPAQAGDQALRRARQGIHPELTAVKPYKARGIASWYGKKFHGQKTSIGEPYDMFAMTAAHTTLALPSYARVTNVQTGKSVIVRVTDRGPFHADRVIDLSYTAAYKLGLINGGSGQVEVEAIIPGEATGTTYAQTTPPPARQTAAEKDDHRATGPPHGARGTTGANCRHGRHERRHQHTEGVYLQLGAFSNADNAENLKNHLTPRTGLGGRGHAGQFRRRHPPPAPWPLRQPR